jgi:predicted RNA-binding Zn-ribbon protein involved in translation (DUF1610 family)
MTELRCVSCWQAVEGTENKRGDSFLCPYCAHVNGITEDGKTISVQTQEDFVVNSPH